MIAWSTAFAVGTVPRLLPPNSTLWANPMRTSLTILVLKLWDHDQYDWTTPPGPFPRISGGCVACVVVKKLVRLKM